jgi:hypothetical protein
MVNYTSFTQFFQFQIYLFSSIRDKCSTLYFLLLFVFQVYGLNKTYAAYLCGSFKFWNPPTISEMLDAYQKVYFVRQFDYNSYLASYSMILWT